MNLTVAEVAELPLAAALLDGDEVLAHTPEWRAAGPGAVTYRSHRSSLVVSTADVHPMCLPLVTRLLEEIDAAAASLPHRQSLRVSMLAAALRIVAGGGVGPTGRSAEVLENACAGIAARTALAVSVHEVEDFAVLAPSVAALVLVQLAANAERHDRAASVMLSARELTFTVGWPGAQRSSGVATARRRAERTRWGLGFARIAADAIGGVVYPPAEDAAGLRSAVLEVGLNRLALPLALLGGTHGVTVRKATRTWDEETSLIPGSVVPPESRAARCSAAAATVPGAIVQQEGWSGRSVAGGNTWLAIPRDDVLDRARDVLDGMVHERALWESVPDPVNSRIVALAAILASLLGGDLDRVSGETWNRRAPQVAAAYGLTIAVPRFEGVGAVDPRVALFLAAEFGDRLDAEGDDLHLRIAPQHRENPLVRVFLAPGDDSLKLS